MKTDQTKSEIFHNLDTDERVKFVKEQFPQIDSDIIAQLIESLNPDELTYDSLELTIKELLINGLLATSYLTLNRNNIDLREQVKKERKLCIILVMAIIAGATIIVLMLFLFAGYPKNRFFQTIDNSVICEISPENNPSLTDSAIQDFARLAVVDAYSFNYINYREQLENSTTRYFTSEGRTAFNQALKNSGSLNHIISNNLIMKTFVTSTAQIEDKGIDNSGQTFWVVRMPVTVEFYTGDSKPADVQKFIAQVRIVSTKRSARNTKGIGVLNLTLRPPKSE